MDTNFTVQILSKEGTWVAGRDSVEALRSRELNTLVLLDDKNLSEDDFRLAVSRLRMQGDHRVIVAAGSKSAKWFLDEMIAEE